MTQVLWVPGPLPGMNEIVAAAKGAGGTGRAYARMKKDWTNTVALLAKAAGLSPVARCTMDFLWSERTKRRDPDNVCAGGRKLVLDGLVLAGVLPNDGWANVAGWRDRWSSRPGDRYGVEVRIISDSDGG